MKILIISYSDSGGAGVAALRLHQALVAEGEESRLLCFNKSSDYPGVVFVQKSLRGRILEHLPFPLWNNKYRKIARLIDRDYECVSFPESIDYITNHPLVEEADVINLHWVGSILPYKKFFKKIRKPIVWTLHDMNPFLGCAHFDMDVNRFPEWQEIEDAIRIKKEKWIHQARSLVVVDLCRWMQSHSSTSGALGRYVHHIIRNSIDISIFKPYDKKSVRDILEIPLDKKVLMFASQKISNYRKGYDLLQKALEQIDDCFLLVLGASSDSVFNKKNVRYLGAVKDERLMAYCYAAADAFLLPSREDNLPNTMVESLCCGTPVITMPNGGMIDIVENGVNGYISKDVSTEGLIKAISDYMIKGVGLSREEISRKAHGMFSPAVQAKAYISVFRNAVKQYEKIS